MAQEINSALIFYEDRIEWASVQDGNGHVESGSVQCPGWIDGDDPVVNGVVEELKGLNKIIGERVTIALPTDRLLTRVIRLPTVEPDELMSMVKLQVDKLSPFAEEDTVWSHEVLSFESDSALLLIVIAHKQFIQKAGDLAGKAGYQSVRVDAAALGLAGCVANSENFNENGRAVQLVVRRAEAELLVFDSGLLVACRALTFPPDMDPAAFGEETGRETVYTLLSLEVELGPEKNGRSVALWLDKGIDPATVEGIKKEIGGSVGSELLENLEPSAAGVARRTASLSAGLVDMTPAHWHEAVKQHEFKSKVAFWCGGVLILWLILAGAGTGVFIFERSKVAALREKEEQLSRESLDVRELRGRVYMLKQYNDTSHSALESLWEINRFLPKGIELTSFAYRKGENIRITGEAARVDDVYKFKTELDGSDLFVESSLQSVRRDQRRRKEIFDIEILLPEEEW